MMEQFILNFALVLHLIVEVPASLNFFLRPSATLSCYQAAAHGVIRQYALLLLSTNIIVACMLGISGPLPRQVAAALGIYHLGPLLRAISRIGDADAQDSLGGPKLHAFAHSACALLLLAAFLLK